MKKKTEVKYDGKYLKVVKDVATGWEYVISADSVAALVYVTDLNQVILIKQFRPPLVGVLGENHRLNEVIAGKRDRDIKIEDLVCAELKEEAGMIIDKDQIKFINNNFPFATSCGLTNEMMYLCYVEITSKQMKKSKSGKFGLKHEGENTTRLLLDPIHLFNINCYDLKTFALITWFRYKYLRDNVENEMHEIATTSAKAYTNLLKI